MLTSGAQLVYASCEVCLSGEEHDVEELLTCCFLYNPTRACLACKCRC